jgi:hypothetical protein
VASWLSARQTSVGPVVRVVSAPCVRGRCPSPCRAPAAVGSFSGDPREPEAGPCCVGHCCAPEVTFFHGIGVLQSRLRVVRVEGTPGHEASEPPWLLGTGLWASVLWSICSSVPSRGGPVAAPVLMGGWDAGRGQVRSAWMWTWTWTGRLRGLWPLLPCSPSMPWAGEVSTVFGVGALLP